MVYMVGLSKFILKISPKANFGRNQFKIERRNNQKNYFQNSTDFRFLQETSLGFQASAHGPMDSSSASILWTLVRIPSTLCTFFILPLIYLPGTIVCQLLKITEEGLKGWQKLKKCHLENSLPSNLGQRICRRGVYHFAFLWSKICIIEGSIWNQKLQT